MAEAEDDGTGPHAGATAASEEEVGAEAGTRAAVADEQRGSRQFEDEDEPAFGSLEDGVGEDGGHPDGAAGDAPAGVDLSTALLRGAALESEASRLQDRHRKASRDADTVSDETYAEAKRLLQLFGVPYVEAPEEAEAQCAQLEGAGLVDGVVTEDSDALLLGARSVYKHLFDPQHHVEVYEMADVEAELNVSRDELIALAHLLGSDYTDGVHGVGIVNAMEAVAAFGACDDGLRAFAKWVGEWRGDVPGGSQPADQPFDEDKDEGRGAVAAGEAADEEAEAREERMKAYKRRHQTVRRNWVLPANFPSRAVTEAYRKPAVDHSEAPCTWSQPDLQGLRAFCYDKFGWNQAKADEALLPVMAEISKGSTQARIDSLFHFEHRFAKVGSKRLASAIRLHNAPPPAAPKGRGRRGKANGKANGKASASGSAADGAGDAADGKKEADEEKEEEEEAEEAGEGRGRGGGAKEPSGSARLRSVSRSRPLRGRVGSGVRRPGRRTSRSRSRCRGSRWRAVEWRWRSMRRMVR